MAPDHLFIALKPECVVVYVQDKHCIRILALCRQDTRFGTYANNADPNQIYFENGVRYANNVDPVQTYFKNGVLLKLVLGAWPVLHILVLVMNRLNTTESAIFIYSVCSLLSKDLTIQNLYTSTAAGVVPCGGRKTSPRTAS